MCEKLPVSVIETESAGGIEPSIVATVGHKEHRAAPRLSTNNTGKLKNERPSKYEYISSTDDDSGILSRTEETTDAVP